MIQQSCSLCQHLYLYSYNIGQYFVPGIYMVLDTKKKAEEKNEKKNENKGKEKTRMPPAPPEKSTINENKRGERRPD